MSTISVLLPIYYKESVDVINKCLNSMISQTVRPNQIVCALDDPSTPDIEDAIDVFEKESGIKVIKLYCKRGICIGSILYVVVQNFT